MHYGIMLHYYETLLLDFVKRWLVNFFAAFMWYEPSNKKAQRANFSDFINRESIQLTSK